jgi:putative transcriptional regulator
MADVRMTREQARAAARIDHAKADALTEAEADRQRIEDEGGDFDPASYLPAPRHIREKIGMTQEALAAAIGVPVGTWRNWEQGRVQLDAPTLALLRILWREPKAALRALRHAA